MSGSRPLRSWCLPLLIGLLAGLPVWFAERGPEPSAPDEPRPWHTSVDKLELDRLGRENQALRTEVATLGARVVELEGELAVAHEAIYAQETEYQTWLQVLGAVAPETLAETLGAAAAASEPAAEPELDPSIGVARRMAIAVRNLFRSESIQGLDLLEPGAYRDGHLGPVVFRTLDDRGRLTGSITAARLRFEAGLAARTVTLILEDGSEHRDGHAEPFAVRRVPFARVDPRPWIARLPELFQGVALLDEGDDGRWDVEALRARLNELLGRNASAGFFRLRHLGGVNGELLLDVHLDEFNDQGRLTRYLFADSARVSLLDRGVRIELLDCAAMRGEVKTLFPGGQHRLFLPYAKAEVWRAARVPGIPAPAPKPDSQAPPES